MAETNRMKRIIFFLCLPLMAAGQDTAVLKELYPQLAGNQGADRFEIHERIGDEWMGVNLDSPLYHAGKMLELARKYDNPEWKSRAYLQKGLAYGYLYKFDQEQQYFRKALAISRTGEDPHGVGVALLNLGVSKLYQGVLDSSAYYFEQARGQFEKLGDSARLAQTYNNLGLIYRKIRRYDKAIDMYEQSIAIKEQLDQEKGLLNTYLNLTSLYNENAQYNKVLPLSERILALSRELDLPDYFVSGLNNLGIAYKNLEAYDQAEVAFKEGLEMLRDFHEPQLSNEINFSMAELAYLQGKLSLSRAYLKETKKWFDQYKNLEAQRAYYELSYKVFRDFGQTTRALKELEKFTEINEQFLNEKSLEQINELQGKYELEKKERTIAQLELEQKQAALSLANYQNQRNLFVFAAAMFLLLAGFLYYRYYIKQKTSKLLEQKNEQISQALAEREILLKEIHHRVKNNLQVITSLLNLQAGTLKEPAAIDAVREGQNRVKSMSIIHQKLYQGQDIRGVDAREYIENLTRELFTAFGVKDDEVNCEIDANGLKLDIDTIIPLGLILNELITNSLKYAFEGRKQGKLQIFMKNRESILEVTVADNGKGMDERTPETAGTFGWKMIRSLSRKLRAEIRIFNQGGTTVQLLLSRFRLVT